jgi:hypothetical protein
MSKTTEAPERTPLTGEAIEAGAGVFAPSDGAVYDRVVWLRGALEATNGNASGVARDIEAYYALKGRAVPRGYKRASIVNASSVLKAYDETACGTTADKQNNHSAATLVGTIDAAREAHGIKAVLKLIKATHESLSTDVKPLVRYRAMLDALKALADAPLPDKDETPGSVPTFATFVARAAALLEYGRSIADDKWTEGKAGLGDDDKDNLESLSYMLANVVK